MTIKKHEKWRPLRDAEQLAKPLRWRKPRQVWLDGDLFDGPPFEQVASVFGVMAACQQHTYIIATKRPARAVEWFEWVERDDQAANDCAIEADKHGAWTWPDELPPWPLRNVIMLASVEDQATADERIPLLLLVPAAVRGVSLEPMLGAVDLRSILLASAPHRLGAVEARLDALSGVVSGPDEVLPSLDWVIVGGDKDPMHPDWVRSVRDQCAETGVPFLFKQWGEWCRGDQLPDDAFLKMEAEGAAVDPLNTYRVGKRMAGRLLDGEIHDEYPEVGNG